MSRRFPLEGVLRARRLAEEGAAASLERANRGHREAEQAIVTAKDRLAGLGFDAAAHGSGGSTRVAARAWDATVASRQASALAISELTGALHEAAVAADAAAQEWGEARMRVSMIEKLGERHAATVIAEDLAAEQLVLDEAALRRTLDKEDR